MAACNDLARLGLIHLAASGLENGRQRRGSGANGGGGCRVGGGANGGGGSGPRDRCRRRGATASDARQGFRTDAQISRGSEKQRELKRFNFVASGADFQEGTLEELASGTKDEEKWDQFKVNEEKFGVVSTFKSDLSQYTTVLDKRKITKEMRQKADRIAQELEKGGACDAREEEEHVDSGADEEDLFSAVPRGSEGAAAQPSRQKHLQQQQQQPQSAGAGIGSNSSNHSSNGSSPSPRVQQQQQQHLQQQQPSRQKHLQQQQQQQPPDFAGAGIGSPDGKEAGRALFSAVRRGLEEAAAQPSRQMHLQQQQQQQPQSAGAGIGSPDGKEAGRALLASLRAAADAKREAECNTQALAAPKEQEWFFQDQWMAGCQVPACAEMLVDPFSHQAALGDMSQLFADWTGALPWGVDPQSGAGFPSLMAAQHFDFGHMSQELDWSQMASGPGAPALPFGSPDFDWEQMATGGYSWNQPIACSY